MKRNEMNGAKLFSVLPIFRLWPHAMPSIHFAFKLLFREQLAEIIVATCASSLEPDGIYRHPKLVGAEPMWRMLNVSRGGPLFSAHPPIRHWHWPWTGAQPKKNADLRFANAWATNDVRLSHRKPHRYIPNNLLKTAEAQREERRKVETTAAELCQNKSSK